MPQLPMSFNFPGPFNLKGTPESVYLSAADDQGNLENVELIEGSNITITNNDNGTVSIASSAGGGGNANISLPSVVNGVVCATDTTADCITDPNFTFSSGGGFNLYGGKLTVGSDGDLNAAAGNFTVAADGSISASVGNFTVDSSGNVIASGHLQTSTDVVVNGTMQNNSSVSVIAGDSGNLQWSMPEQGQGYKKVLVLFDSYTAAGTASITFPTAFLIANDLSIYSAASASGLLAANLTLTLSHLNISALTAISGAVVIEGF